MSNVNAEAGIQHIATPGGQIARPRRGRPIWPALAPLQGFNRLFSKLALTRRQPCKVHTLKPRAITLGRWRLPWEGAHVGVWLRWGSKSSPGALNPALELKIQPWSAKSSSGALNPEPGGCCNECPDRRHQRQAAGANFPGGARDEARATQAAAQLTAATVSCHSQAVSCHSPAVSCHSPAVSCHSQAVSCHSPAVSCHSPAVSCHSPASDRAQGLRKPSNPKPRAQSVWTRRMDG